MQLMTKLYICISIFVVALGVSCFSSDADVYTLNDDYDISRVQAPIINGVDWPNGLGDGRYVSVHTPSGMGSGTLLRNNVVLTAKHVIHNQGFVDQTSGFYPPASITVTDQSRTRVSGVTSYQVRNDPNVEVAILQLTTPLPLGGREFLGIPFGGFTQASLEIPEFQFGNWYWCAGYGLNTATQAQCNADFGGAGAGDLRGHWNVAQDSGSGGDTSHLRITFLNNGSDQNRASGDSGSSCVEMNNAGNVWQVVDVLGWYTDGATCASYGTQWGPSGLDGLSTTGFAWWMRSFIGDWTGDTYDGYDTNTTTLGWYDIVDPTNPSGPSNWQENTSWYYIYQSANTYQWIGDVLDGTKLLFPWRPMNDAQVTANIWSQDDDAAGVILRYQDPTHYYQVTVDEQRERVQFAKRQGNTYTHVKSVPISFDWGGGNWHSVSVGAFVNPIQFEVVVDGKWRMTATDPDNDYMDGYAGIILAGMQPAYVDSFEIANY